MNVVREIQRINQKELDIAINSPSASWHEQYKDSAYIFLGGIPYDLTEGDVITIFSQYGEVVDVHMPRGGPPPANGQQERDPSRQQQQQQQQQSKGKHRGFGFLMYEDQRSTVLAVDNLNGATILGRTIRVDHVANYKQPKEKGQDGEMIERDLPSMNAAPSMVEGDSDAQPPDEDLDEEDPMANYLRRERREGKSKQADDQDGGDGQATLSQTEKARLKENKRKRKQERAHIRAEREGRKTRQREEIEPTSSRKNNGNEREPTRRPSRSRSPRRSNDSDENESVGEGVDPNRNRYQEMKAAKARAAKEAEPHHADSRDEKRRRDMKPSHRVSRNSSPVRQDKGRGSSRYHERYRDRHETKGADKDGDHHSRLRRDQDERVRPYDKIDRERERPSSGRDLDKGSSNRYERNVDADDGRRGDSRDRRPRHDRDGFHDRTRHRSDKSYRDDVGDRPTLDRR